MSKPVTTLKQGTLRGEKVESATGGSYLSFKGIPYAAPPVGDLRFKDPQPPSTWAGIRDAVTEGSVSAQLDVLTEEFIGNEDCLYLNVATTSLVGSRPVMVWIHGGAFFFGDGGFDMYGPDYLMDADIVYVSFNYRLGALGFLNLDHEVAPGNMGLKDQVAALQWVKENIAQFGGDPGNVTIFGESAGGASVHCLLLSPLAKGLFHKAIMESGVALNPFAFLTNPVDVARQYVAALGKAITDPEEIVEYLRTVPVQRLVEVQQALLTPENHLALKFVFGPGVDDKSHKPFMPRSCQELAADGFDVPAIIGHNSHEGNIMLRSGVFSKLHISKEMLLKVDENFETTVPRDLAAKVPSKVSEIAKVLRKFYFGDKRITEDLADEYVKYWGDVHLVYGSRKAADIQSKKGLPVYFYRFSYDSPDSIYKTLFQVDAKGATHLDELQYLLYATKARELIKMEPGSTDRIVRDRMVRMWTDFAKTGNPTPVIDDLITEKWESLTKTAKNYLEIDAELSAGEHPDQDAWETWERVYGMTED